MRPAHCRRQPRDSPGQREDKPDVDADGHGRLLVVGHRPHGDAHAAPPEEPGETDQEDPGHESGHDVDRREVDLPDHIGLQGNGQRDVLGLGAPDHGRRALEDLGEPDGHHDDRDHLLPDHQPQHAALEGEPQGHHDREQDGQGDDQGQVIERDQRGGHVAAEHHQLALGEVDHAGGLVDQDEAEGDQRVGGPVHEAVDEEVEEERHRASSRPLPARGRPRRGEWPARSAWWPGARPDT